MNDEQDNFHNFHSATLISTPLQPSVLVAVATLVLAGSAVFWRSNLRLANIRLLPKGLGTESEPGTKLPVFTFDSKLIAITVLAEAHEAHGECSAFSLVMSHKTNVHSTFTVIDADESNNAHNDGSKSSRSKERRRRRKDPMKELMKGGKRAKDLTKLLKHLELPGPSDPSSSSVPNSASSSAHFVSQTQQEPSLEDAQPGNFKRNRSGSRSESGARDPSSSRSASICSAAEGSARGRDHSEDQSEEVSLTEIPPSPVGPSKSNLGHSPSTSYDSTPSIAVSTFSFDSVDTADTSVQSAKFHNLDPALDEDKSGSLDTPSASTTPSSKSTKNTRRNKNSNSKNSTLHNVTTNHGPIDPSTLISSQSASAVSYTNQKDSASSSSTLHPITSSSSSPSPSRATKPPRFRSQTRPDEAASGLASSTSMPIYSTFHTASSTSKLETEYPEGEHVEIGDPTPFNFPTLNGVSGSGSGSANDSVASSSKSGSTGPGSTNSTSLSTQTQIASLRGALEASRRREEEARGREERTRSELERLGNEVKMLRWEGGLWRQREGELQAQVHHLAHQVQSYAAYFPSPQQAASQQVPPHIQNLSISQPQQSSGKPSQLKGKRPHTSQNSPASSRSASKSSHPSRSSHASPIPSLAQLPEASATQNSSPSIGSPVIPPSRMFSPATPFSPGSSSTPYPPNLPGMGTFSPSSSFGMFSPSAPPSAGLPFASPPLGATGMMSPLSPHSPYLSYYPSYGAPGQTNGSGASSGGKMHPMQFLNMLNGQNGNGANGLTENGGVSSSSTMSSLASGTESTGSASPESTTSPSPAPGIVRERGRKRGRGGTTGSGDRVMSGYGHSYQQYGYSYGYSYPYSNPSSYQAYPGATQLPEEQSLPEQVKEEGSDDVGRKNAGVDQNEPYISDSDPDDDRGSLNEVLAGAILKRPESMMGLRRSGSGSGRSSKSDIKMKDKLQISPTQDTFKEAGDETVLLTSPSSDSGLGMGLGLDWVKDPALFREPSLQANSPSMTDAHASESASNEIDLESGFSSSSSSSSTKSTTTSSSDSLEEAPPVEFTFPSIATWGYSYQTHSAEDFDDHTKMKEPMSMEILNADVDLEEGQEHESTPPADRASIPIPTHIESPPFDGIIATSEGPTPEA
ncbi:hypothetical protein GYMLUDRAFT_236977 [Collybiopsis luxurians FD-317 M1]|nr:hypothetical protein GYMLUDRAFT_236977 [Collybiopsis luxurians FD-317 M1]